MFSKVVSRVNDYVRDVIINSIAASNFMPLSLRKWIYRMYGINVKTKAIRPNCYFGGNKVSIGSGTTINGRCYFENLESIEIGSNCNIAMDVLFCTSTHEIGSSDRRAGRAYGRTIKVGNACWIGAKVTILPGVTIEDGCIIAAGSVVTKDCKMNGLYAGVPAIRVKELNANEDVVAM